MPPGCYPVDRGKQNRCIFSYRTHGAKRKEISPPRPAVPPRTLAPVTGVMASSGDTEGGLTRQWTRQTLGTLF